MQVDAWNSVIDGGIDIVATNFRSVPSKDDLVAKSGCNPRVGGLVRPEFMHVTVWWKTHTGFAASGNLAERMPSGAQFHQPHVGSGNRRRRLPLRRRIPRMTRFQPQSLT